MLVALEKLPVEDKTSLLQQLWQSLFSDYRTGKISYDNLTQIKRELADVEIDNQPTLQKRQFGLYEGKGSFELMDDFEMTDAELMA